MMPSGYMDNQCSFPRCKNPADCGYIGQDICYTHWIQLCEADSKTEKRLLKKIGLVRNCGGAIVTIIPTEDETDNLERKR